MAGGYDGRIAPTRTRTPGTAGSKSPEGVRELISAAHVVIPGREPHGDAMDDGLRDAVMISGSNASDEKNQADESQARTPPRDSKQRKEYETGDEGGAHIFENEKEDERTGD